jgi:osmoprotectant transport system substrate-binding protein
MAMARRGVSARLAGRSAAAFAVALVVSLLATACGGSDKNITLTIGMGETAEETILGQIYAQALTHAGYTVKMKRLDREGKGAANALLQGTVSGYPEHLDAALTASPKAELEQAPADPQKAYEAAKASLEEEGLTAFPPAPFSLTNVVGALRATAEERGLEKVSDLSGQSAEMTISGVTGCHNQINCVGGLERLYGLEFAGFVYRLGVETEPFEALETRFSDLAMLPSTDGRLATEKDELVILDEDRRLFPAGNAFFVTKPAVVKAAGPDFEATVIAAQEGLTLSVMQELDAKVEIEEQDPTDVAAEHLSEAGLG